MYWIVKIEGEENKNKRIRIEFKPIREQIHFYGEYKYKNEWNIFSHYHHNDLNISLKEIQDNLEICLIRMNRRLSSFDNLDKGFSVLKWIALKEDDE